MRQDIKNSKKKKLLFLSLIMSLIILMCMAIYVTRPMNDIKYDLNNTKYYIAHAGGGIDGFIYTNSKEAVLNSIGNGFKYIELDLFLSQDENLLCIHDIYEFNKMTDTKDTSLSINTEEFKSRVIYKKYTPLTLTEVLQIQNKYSFIIVIDKISKPKILNKFITPANKGKMYVEALSGNDYYELLTNGYKPMLALYEHKIIRYLYHLIIKRHRIKWIVTSAEREEDFYTLRFLKRLFGVKIAFFAPQDHQYSLNKHIGNEIDLLYTDSIHFKE
jgi:hypothetical protein